MKNNYRKVLTNGGTCDIIYKSSGNRRQTRYARVVELVDSLDSGSSAHSGRGGSTPPSRTIRDRRKPVSFFASRALTERLKTPGFHAFFGIQGIFCICLGIVAYLQVLSTISFYLGGERAAVVREIFTGQPLNSGENLDLCEIWGSFR